MRIHYILHASFEKLGTIENWAQKNNHYLSGTHTYKGEQLPDTAQFDMLIIMGGPQSAVELDKYSYLRDEVTFIKQVIKENRPVLGICLGAQLIGAALDASPEQSPNKEIGIYPIQATAEALQDPLFKKFPKQFDVMHWHNDMPGLPKGGVLLAKSAGCPRQAFRYGDKVYGFQFHMELTPELVKKMLEHCPKDLEPSSYVQSKVELLKQDLTAINQKMHITLDYLAGMATLNK